MTLLTLVKLVLIAMPPATAEEVFSEDPPGAQATAVQSGTENPDSDKPELLTVKIECFRRTGDKAQVAAPDSYVEGRGMVHVVARVTGPIRELEWSFDPQPEDIIFARERREAHFAVPAGQYAVELIGVHQVKGIARAKIVITVKPARAPAAAKVENNADPESLVRRWYEEVSSPNKTDEAHQIAAGMSTFRTISEVKAATIQSLGSAAASWNQFFANAERMIDVDSPKAFAANSRPYTEGDRLSVLRAVGKVLEQMQ